MSNKLLDMVAFKKLEKMPTKQEIFTTLARLLKQVSMVLQYQRRLSKLDLKVAYSALRGMFCGCLV